MSAGADAATRERIETRGGARVLNINGWNEWTEGSYLEPDTATGMAYLEAVRDVFGARCMGPRRPNVLWICTDQQRGDTIRALGNAHINTPNLDRPCAEGVARF